MSNKSIKSKLKQCFVQFDDGSYSTLWVDIKEAIENNSIKIENKILNINGQATILKVYNLIVIDA